MKQNGWISTRTTEIPAKAGIWYFAALQVVTDPRFRGDFDCGSGYVLRQTASSQDARESGRTKPAGMAFSR
jgi:hypothetical protein